MVRPDWKREEIETKKLILILRRLYNLFNRRETHTLGQDRLLRDVRESLFDEAS
jgi:hypothetical protein